MRILTSAVVCATLAVPCTFQAATFTVNSTADGVDGEPGDGRCVTPNERTCTLRAAIMEANALAGADSILLPAGTVTVPAFNMPPPSPRSSSSSQAAMGGQPSVDGWPAMSERREDLTRTNP